MKDWIKSQFPIIIIGFVCIISTLIAIFISFKPPAAGELASATGLSTMLKFFIALSAVCLWFVFLRLSDTLAGIKFKEAYAAIESNGIALAVYFGLRSLGAGVLLGMLLG